MKIGAAFPSKYLKADDLGTARPTVVIDTVTMEDVGGEGKQQPVVHFQGKDKGLVLNRTNAMTIEAITKSDDTDHWEGVAIRLYATPVSFQGRMVNAIRVEAAPQKKAKPAPVAAPVPVDVADDEDDDDPIPF
jgi:hypothetical protein